MLYKFSPFGYFSRTAKISRGPWFEHHKAEEDGLEAYYTYSSEGQKQYLLSNNIPWADRERMAHLYAAIARNGTLALFGGMWLSMETVLRVPKLRKLAIGWRVLAFGGIGMLYKSFFDF